MSRFEVHVDELSRDTPKISAARVVQIIRERAEPSFQVSERAAREYVSGRRSRIVPKEAFVGLVYAPGNQVQFDFKDVGVKIGGVEVPLHFVGRLSYSTVFFARSYCSEDQTALFNGFVSSCTSFGGIARDGLFDNASSTVIINTAVNRMSYQLA